MDSGLKYCSDHDVTKKTPKSDYAIMTFYCRAVIGTPTIYFYFGVSKQWFDPGKLSTPLHHYHLDDKAKTIQPLRTCIEDSKEDRESKRRNYGGAENSSSFLYNPSKGPTQNSAVCEQEEPKWQKRSWSHCNREVIVMLREKVLERRSNAIGSDRIGSLLISRMYVREGKQWNRMTLCNANPY